MGRVHIDGRTRDVVSLFRPAGIVGTRRAAGQAGQHRYLSAGVVVVRVKGASQDDLALGITDGGDAGGNSGILAGQGTVGTRPAEPIVAHVKKPVGVIAQGAHVIDAKDVIDGGEGKSARLVVQGGVRKGFNSAIKGDHHVGGVSLILARSFPVNIDPIIAIGSDQLGDRLTKRGDISRRRSDVGKSPVLARASQRDDTTDSIVVRRRDKRAPLRASIAQIGGTSGLVKSVRNDRQVAPGNIGSPVDGPATSLGRIERVTDDLIRGCGGRG